MAVCVLVVLGAILIPPFMSPNHYDQLTACHSHLKNIATACEMYSTDNQGRYPRTLSALTPAYLKTIPTCPAAGQDTYSGSFRSVYQPDVPTCVDNYTVICQGSNHENVGEIKNYPQYTCENGLVDVNK
jgi:hypothetical protein